MSAYEMRIYQVAHGKMEDIQQVLRDLVTPLMAKYAMQGVAFWATNDSEIYWVVKHQSADVIQSDWERFHADPLWKEGLAARNHGTPLVVSERSIPLAGISGLPPESVAMNQELVTSYVMGLFGNKDLTAVDRCLASDFKQHNPHAQDGPEGVKAFASYFFKSHPEASAEPRRIAASADLVFVHTLLKLNARDHGSAVVDIYRVQDGKIAEHWDVMQPVPENTPSGNPMA